MSDLVLSALTELVATLKDLLQGKAPSPRAVRRLGPFAGLFLTPAHTWRPDGCHRATAFLASELRSWLGKNNFRAYRGLEAKNAVQAMELRWGLTSYPQGPAAISQKLKLDLNPATIARWEDKVLQECAERLGGGPAPDYPGFSGSPHSTWAVLPIELWPPNGLNGAVDERSVLIGRVRRTLQATPAFDADRLPPNSELVHVLRNVVRSRLLEYFDADTEKNAYRHILHSVLPAWDFDDPARLFAPVPKPRAREKRVDPSGSGSYPLAVAVATQMLMYRAAVDVTALTEEIARRTGLEEFANKLLLDTTQPIAVSKLAIALPEQRASRLVVPQGVAEEGPTGLEETATATDSLAYASIVRNADRALKVSLSKLYVASRPSRAQSVKNSAGAEELALADQSIQWDLVVAEEPRLCAALAHVIQTFPAGARPELLCHQHRAMIVLHNKANLSDEANTYGVAGIGELARLENSDSVGIVAAYESAQQLELALAGVWVRALERSFLRCGDFGDLHLWYARGALWWSAAAGARLSFLAREDVEGGLPAERHTDGRISSTGWNVQTRLIRLRTLVAVRTALAAGLFSEAQLREELRGPAAFPPPPYDGCGVEHSCLDHLLVLYKELVTRPEISTGAQLDLVRTATWLALLNGGNIPAVRDLSPALKTLTFLDLDPETLASDSQPVSLDYEKLVEWLSLRTPPDDLASLSWIDMKSSVARRLDKTSRGGYVHLRKLHDDYRPAEPSYD